LCNFKSKTWTKSSPLLKTQLTDLTDYPQNANVGRSSSNLILCIANNPPSLSLSLPSSLKLLLLLKAQTTFPQTQTQNETKPNPFFLPPSLPNKKLPPKTAIFGYYSTHPTTTKVITNTTTPATTTPTTIPSPHYNCNLLPLLKIKCKAGPKCDGGIFEFLKKHKSFPESKTFLQSPKPSSSSSSSSSSSPSCH
jgi:hypothetical protein